jgi:hypothetical protein
MTARRVRGVRSEDSDDSTEHDMNLFKYVFNKGRLLLMSSLMWSSLLDHITVNQTEGGRALS